MADKLSPKLAKRLNEYLRGKGMPYEVDDIIDPELVNEMLVLANKKRADFLYTQCIRLGHYRLAEKLALKYGPFQRYDRVMAFGLSLMAKRIIDNPHSNQ